MNRLKTSIIRALGVLLPTTVKNSMLHLSFHLAKAEFEHFAYLYNFAPNMEEGLKAVALRGLSPRTVIDVGAFEGDWSRMARRIWPGSNLLMFEPNTLKADVVSSTATEINASFFKELLGAEDGKVVVFNVMESGSSVMNERSAVDRVTERRVLRRMDTVLNEVEGPILLKIDAQGYELEILRGSAKLLRSFEGIILEVAIIEVNEGAPLLHEVTAYMKSIGFIAYEILEIHRRPLDQALNQIDILFVPEDSKLIADKRHYA